MNQVINEDLIPVRFQIINLPSEGEVLHFINKNNKEVFKINGSLLGNNMLKNKHLVGLIKFNYVKNLIIFDSADFSDSNELLNLRLFMIDFKGNILLDLKDYYTTKHIYKQNDSSIYLYKYPNFKNKKVCFLKDDLSIVETSYSKFEKTVLNGFLVSRVNKNEQKEFALYSKDYELLVDTITSEELDLKFLLNIK